MPQAAKPEARRKFGIDFTPSREQYIRMLNLILRDSPFQEDRIFAYNELEKIFNSINPGREF